MYQNKLGISKKVGYTCANINIHKLCSLCGAHVVLVRMHCKTDNDKTQLAIDRSCFGKHIHRCPSLEEMGIGFSFGTDGSYVHTTIFTQDLGSSARSSSLLLPSIEGHSFHKSENLSGVLSHYGSSKAKIIIDPFPPPTQHNMSMDMKPASSHCEMPSVIRSGKLHKNAALGMLFSSLWQTDEPKGKSGHWWSILMLPTRNPPGWSYKIDTTVA